MDREQLIQQLEDRLARAAFVESVIKETVPAQIRAMMAQRGWTQMELAEKAGVASSTVSAILNGDVLTTSITTLTKIAGAFDVSLEARFCSWDELIRWWESFGFVVPRGYENE